MKKKKADVKVRSVTYGRTIRVRDFESAKVELSADVPRGMSAQDAVNRLEILVKTELDKRFARFR